MIGFIDAAAGAVARKVGLETDPLKLFLTFILSYPLCAVLKRLPDSTPVYKQFFCIVYDQCFAIIHICDIEEY